MRGPFALGFDEGTCETTRLARDFADGAAGPYDAWPRGVDPFTLKGRSDMGEAAPALLRVLPLTAKAVTR